MMIVLRQVDYAFGFIRDFETIFHGPFWYIVDALLNFFFYGSYIFGAVMNEEVVNI